MPKKSLFDEILERKPELYEPSLFKDKGLRKRIYNKCRRRCKAKKRSNVPYDECLLSCVQREMQFIMMGIEPASKHKRTHGKVEKSRLMWHLMEKHGINLYGPHSSYDEMNVRKFYF